MILKLLSITLFVIFIGLMAYGNTVSVFSQLPNTLSGKEKNVDGFTSPSENTTHIQQKQLSSNLTLPHNIQQKQLSSNLTPHSLIFAPPPGPNPPSEGPPQLAIVAIGHIGNGVKWISQGEDVSDLDQLEFRIHFTNYVPVKDNQMLIKRVFCELDGVPNSLSCQTHSTNPFELFTTIDIHVFMGGTHTYFFNDEPGMHTFSISIETVDKGTVTAKFSFNIIHKIPFDTSNNSKHNCKDLGDNIVSCE